MSDYPQVLGPHIISLTDTNEYLAWLNTHFFKVPNPGEAWILSIRDTQREIILIGDGQKAFGELKDINDEPQIKYYRISETDLRELLSAAHYAWALEFGGVDNWTWEADSRHDYLSQYNADQGTDFDNFEDLAEHELKLYYYSIIDFS